MHSCSASKIYLQTLGSSNIVYSSPAKHWQLMKLWKVAYLSVMLVTRNCESYGFVVDDLLKLSVQMEFQLNQTKGKSYRWRWYCASLHHIHISTQRDRSCPANETWHRHAALQLSAHSSTVWLTHPRLRYTANHRQRFLHLHISHSVQFMHWPFTLTMVGHLDMVLGFSALMTWKILVIHSVGANTLPLIMLWLNFGFHANFGFTAVFACNGHLSMASQPFTTS